MSHDLRHGFHRLFLALTMAWAISCAVLYPLQYQFKGQIEANAQRSREYADCGKLAGTDLGGQDCFDDAEANWKSATELYSLKKFWMLDVVFWRLEIPAIVLPPLIVYTLAILVRWIWRGFKPKSGERA